MKKDKTSKYSGVSWRKSARKWVAAVTIKGVKHHVGSFDDEREAAKMVDICLMKHGKEPKNLKWNKK